MMNHSFPICDLHTHSTFSDGTLTPAALLQRAVNIGLSAIALTDHNTIGGLSEFLTAAQNLPVQAIPGVEISSVFNGKQLHIVGLFIQPKYFDRLINFLEIPNKSKTESNRRLISSLRASGYGIDSYDEIQKRCSGSINRAVIASELLKKGYINSIAEAFSGILSRAAGHYVPPKRIAALEAIEFLKSIEAVPILAHPFLDLSEDELRLFLPEAKKVGLAAMETRYSTYSPETAALAYQIAREYDLKESGGSDYHGDNKPTIELGSGTGALCVPYAFAQQLQA